MCARSLVICRKRIVISTAALAVVLAAVAATWWFLSSEPSLRIAEILARYDEGQTYGAATIRYPFPDALFPPDIAAPTFRWEEGDKRADAWVIRIEFQDGGKPLAFGSRSQEWTPAEEDWSTIKARSRGAAAKVTLLGVQRARQDVILSAARTVLHTSPDEVGAPIFYREVNLPFIEAVKDPSQIRWRFGPVDSTEQPPIVLGNLPVCGNCHSFSKDGATMGLDVNYANDKGSYAILPVGPEMVLDRQRIITWSDYKREDREPTFGLLSAISPDGRHAVSTVKDRSVFVPADDLAYSQLFFPIRGILAIHDRQTGEIHSLPGADDPQFVQSNPTWSPDGKYLVVARSRAYKLRQESADPKVLLTQAECKEFLTKEKSFLFDLYRIPFNDGKGGKAEPLAGASLNGMSNYFAKYSPDGKWIIFCRAKSFMLLQPDSELWIIPAEGGAARRLACNLPGMNSWHSWSPNGKWLVFSSKTFTPYTQLFLTHIDERGESAPAVLLSRFTAPDRAANIPEFVNLKPDAIKNIAVNFLDDYNYARLARDQILEGDLERAETNCRKALALNPENPEALGNLGVVMVRRGEFAEAIDPLARAVASDPKSIDGRMNLAHCLTELNRLPESLEHYREAVRLDPELFGADVPGAEFAAIGPMRRGGRTAFGGGADSPCGRRGGVASGGGLPTAGKDRRGGGPLPRRLEAAARLRAGADGPGRALFQRQSVGSPRSGGGAAAGDDGLRSDEKRRPRVAGRAGDRACRGGPLCRSRPRRAAEHGRGGQGRQHAVHAGDGARVRNLP